MEVPQACIARMKHINLSFAACGFLGIYHLGAASALYRHGRKLLKDVKAFAGASAGSLVATVLLTAPERIEECNEFTYKFAEEIRRQSFGALTPGYDFMARLRSGMDLILPANAHELAHNRLHVSITNTKTRQNYLVSKFSSREDLIKMTSLVRAPGTSLEQEGYVTRVSPSFLLESWFVLFYYSHLTPQMFPGHLSGARCHGDCQNLSPCARHVPNDMGESLFVPLNPIKGAHLHSCRGDGEVKQAFVGCEKTREGLTDHAGGTDPVPSALFSSEEPRALLRVGTTAQRSQCQLQVLLASSFLPIYAGLKPVEYNGQKWVDGGLTNGLPILPVGRTVTISPFSGRLDISPQDKGQLNVYVNIAKQDMMLSVANLVRLNQALFPPSKRKMESLYQHGFGDTIKFLLKENWFE